EEPFLVLATQNPIEQEGTYPLPEAQMDRFMFKVNIDYPTKDEERDIMRKNINPQEQISIKPILNPEVILQARNSINKIYMDEKIETYILDIVFATRNPDKVGLNSLKNLISYGASPRASINMALAAKGHAFLQRRGFVIPEDVRAICHNILKHRIGLTYEAEAEEVSPSQIISKIINHIKVP
ncbi:MAG: hypothetical protein RLZZ546_1299, partial [Bacteroidota bacterium]